MERSREIAKEIVDEGMVGEKALDYYQDLIEEYAYDRVLEERQNIMGSIDRVRTDWRDYGDHPKADACAYLLGYLDRNT